MTKLYKDESSLKKDIRVYLSSIGAYWTNIAGTVYNTKGHPDIFCIYKGKAIGIEAKNPNGNGIQSQWQKDRQQEIEDNGGIYILADTLEDVTDFFNKLS